MYITDVSVLTQPPPQPEQAGTDSAKKFDEIKKGRTWRQVRAQTEETEKVNTKVLKKSK